MKKILLTVFLFLNFLVLCSCNTAFSNNEINVEANFTFFPTEKSGYKCDDIRSIFDEFTKSNFLYENWGEYIIYNYTNQEVSIKYDLEIFEVDFENGSSRYYILYKGKIFDISQNIPYNIELQFITHAAITDINADGYIEILTSISYKFGISYNSIVTIIDTFSSLSMEINDIENISFFKENDNGVLSIYCIYGISSLEDDIINGKLNEKYFNLANYIYETPTLNLSRYEFSEYSVKASCDLFEVSININDDFLDFPYLFKNASTPPSFKLDVVTKYLGKSFQYYGEPSYLVGAEVSFVYNGEYSNSKIECIERNKTPFSYITINTGEVTNRTYVYNDDVYYNRNEGSYDMIITYNPEGKNINETIVIKDFLNYYRLK
mgnify:CR=1 FL=1